MKLRLCLVVFLMFLFTSCNNSSHAQNDFYDDTITQEPTTVLSKEDSTRMMIEIKYNDALFELDSLNGERIYWEDKYPDEAAAIDSLRQSIRFELKKETADSNKVNSLVAALDEKVDDLITHLKQQKK
jgi:hypothetical protein